MFWWAWYRFQLRWRSQILDYWKVNMGIIFNLHQFLPKFQFQFSFYALINYTRILWFLWYLFILPLIHTILRSLSISFNSLDIFKTIQILMIAVASIRPIKLKMRDFLWRNSCNLSLLKPNSQDSSIFCRFSLLFQLKFLTYSLIKRYSTLELIYRLRKINNFILVVLRFQKLINSLSID